MFRKILYLFAVLLLLSCSNNLRIKDVKQFMGQQITIPDDSYTVWKGRETILFDFTKTPINLVVWYDSLGCTSCEASRISGWSEIVAYTDSLNQWISIIFLFTPKKKDIHRVKIALQTDDFDYPIFIDQNATFVKQNSKLPKNSQLHSFLLDKNNKVVLVGNPLYNTTLWGLYKKTIQCLIDNDGELPNKIMQ